MDDAALKLRRERRARRRARKKAEGLRMTEVGRGSYLRQ